eukprot:TRINITY_DN50_c0_g1_i2.p1 TRINITY_DN50_c0_g1~~TRINITY_DN50_c0_g1_i2.p1  ORF type:complete len:429 (-),score=141.05 TRINITY_DN50_c0_g1_i2:62-1348(-)
MDHKAKSRIAILGGHLAAAAETPSGYAVESVFAAGSSAKSGDDIVIVAPFRTAVGKAKRGGFKDASIDKMLIPVLKHILKTTKLDPSLISDIVVGSVLPRSSQAATEVRVAGLLAGIPETASCMTVNRQCSSGLQAMANVAAAVRSGMYEIGIAGGVESMSLNPMAWDGDLNQDAVKHDTAKGCYMTMGETSENVAERYGIPRKEQDEFAVLSHQRAAAAQKSGRFDAEIVPVTYTLEDGKEVTISKDEGIRVGTTYADLAKLKPAFRPEGGTTTAGNSSQLSDGAAAMLVMKRSTAERLNLQPHVMGVLRSFSSVGVEPAIMGVGPAVAIPAAVKQAGISLGDVDLFEINEAFASQATYCVKKLGLSGDKVNVNGGAIALGHPLGCTGARQVSTLLNEMKKRGSRFGVVSMCIGSGMGAAAVFEREN